MPSQGAQTCPHCSYINNNSADGNVDSTHPCHNCGAPEEHYDFHHGSCDKLTGLEECPHCVQHQYSPEYGDCRECGYPEEHYDNHDGACSYERFNEQHQNDLLNEQNQNNLLNEQHQNDFLNEQHQHQHESLHGFVAPGLFSIKDDGDIVNGPPIIRDHVDDPNNSEDVYRHLEEHPHPNFQDNRSDLTWSHDLYHDLNENNPHLEHYHNLWNHELSHGVSTEDLLNGTEHPNMRLPIEIMPNNSKIKHYTHEHGYLPADNNQNITPEQMDILDKMHHDYHSDRSDMFRDPEDPEQSIELDKTRSEKEWMRHEQGANPSFSIAFPHEHWNVENTEKNKARNDKIEDLLNWADEQADWYKKHKNKQRDFRAHKEDIYSVARKSWNPKEDITFEEYIQKNIYLAARPPDFKPQPNAWEDWDDYDSETDFNPEVIGLPRPQWHTMPESQHYDWSKSIFDQKPEDQPEGKKQNERRLYKKIPVPWNTETMERDIPKFDKDNPFVDIHPKYGDEERADLNREMAMAADEFNLSSWSRSAAEQRCPMCGGNFENNDQAVRYKGSENSEMLSDHLPYHEHCMDLVNKHCPHLRRESDHPELYEHGQYGNLIQNAQNHVRNILKNKRQDMHNDGIDVGLPDDDEEDEEDE